MWRIGINAQLLSGKPGYRQAGIHTYISQLLAHLPTDDDLRYLLFAQRDAPLPAGAHSRLTRLPTERPPVRIVWEQLCWPLAARGLDLLHSMAFVAPLLSRLPAIVTVYDLSFVHYPLRYTPLRRLYLQSMTRLSVQRARAVVAISEDGKRDVQRTWGVAPERVAVVTPGVDDRFRPLPPAAVDEFRRRQGLERRVVLHVGTLQPRKNIPTLLHAFAQIDDPQLELVLVGGKGWLYDEIFATVEQLQLEERVRFTGFVPDAELPFWYNAADVLVFPSIYEGFGIPAASAMACGTPVVAARASSLPEVVGDAGLLFDTQNSEALADCLANVLYDAARAAMMRERGYQQVKRFSWTRSGKKMAAMYRQTLQNR